MYVSVTSIFCFESPVRGIWIKVGIFSDAGAKQCVGVECHRCARACVGVWLRVCVACGVCAYVSVCVVRARMPVSVSVLCARLVYPMLRERKPTAGCSGRGMGVRVEFLQQDEPMSRERSHQAAAWGSY